MISPRVGSPWYTVQQLIEIFTAMGCELREPGILMTSPDGEMFDVRYLYNPQTGEYLELVGLDPSDSLPLSEVEYWERRLGMLVPKGNCH